MNRRLVPAALASALCLAALVFYLDPTIDLVAAGWFYRGHNSFVGEGAPGEAARKVLYWIPTLVLVGFTVLYLLRRFGRSTRWAPSGRGLAVLLLSFALGPGLLVNLILKDHSHRPRPYQTVNFGGDAAFRPFYTFDGDCQRNCSFVSGEGASSAWTLAPALFVPPPFRLAAIVASLVDAVAAGTLRMAFGGHYLSDTIFAALLTWGVIWATWVTIGGRPGARGSPERSGAVVGGDGRRGGAVE